MGILENIPPPCFLPSVAYQGLVRSGGLQWDPIQGEVLPVLDGLVQELNQPVQRVSWRGLAVWRGEGGHSVPKGVYLHGSVGRGKSMLMQMVFEAVTARKKRRVHFHPFMEELHHRLHKTVAPRNIDLMLYIAEQIAEETQLLCFDEFFVTNIGDGMLLGRLLEAFFKCGVTVCATSNWGPDDIYQDGFNRSRVLPFIDTLKRHVQQVSLLGGSDWRRALSAQSDRQVLITPEERYQQLTGKQPHRHPVPVRHMLVEAQGASQGVYWFTFASLCARNIGRSEYLELCHTAKAIVLSDMPTCSEDEADYAMRFIVLVDLLYEYRVPLYVCGEVDLDKICVEGPAAFAFQRTVSRIYELGGM